MSASRHRAASAGGTPMTEVVRRVVERMPGRRAQTADWQVAYRDMHSNDVAEVRFPDGSILHVKRARGPAGPERFRTSREAARLLRERAGVLVPTHLDLEPPVQEPVIAYWRLPERTLEEVIASWGDTGVDLATLVSFGGLIRRLQDVELPGHGPLLSARATLAEFLERDVGDRLRPAVHGEWPEAGEALHRLLYVVRRWVRGQECPAVLVHNDLHVDNVLCRGSDGDHRCVGVLDLEDAMAGAPEADFAKFEVLHGPLFGRPWPRAWLDAVRRGYGEMPDGFRHGVMRIYHLLNLGFYAAYVGLHERASAVAEATGLELDALGADLPHAEVVASVTAPY